MEKLRAAVDEFARFQKMMTERKRYDFDDMINWVIRAFEENKNLLRDTRNNTSISWWMNTRIPAVHKIKWWNY